MEQQDSFENKRKYISSNRKLMLEWDWESNFKAGIVPTQVPINSSKKVFWICSKGHHWMASVNHRNKDGTRCPYCMNRKVLVGFNDLESCRPDLISEWNYEKNEITPSNVMFQSSMLANWICKNGHEWQISIYSRTVKGTNCPYCSNKKVLRGYNDLESQYPELMTEWDKESNALDPSAVTYGSQKKASWICPRGHKYIKSIYRRVNGEECPICNKGRGTSFPEQCFFYYIKKVFPDAINRYREPFQNGMELDIYIPSIMTGIEYDGIFWHGESAINREVRKYKTCKEKGIRLFRIREGSFSGFKDNADRTWYVSNKRDYFELNYHIFDILRFLTFYSKDLPSIDVERDKNEILEYKTVRYKDSLASHYPNIAKEWHPSKNGKLIPDDFIPGASDRVWWLCPICGNEWESSIVNRTKGHGCDVCATGRRKNTKRETLIRKRGSIKKELCWLDWDYETNEHGPEYYTSGSGEVVGWKCHVCGHRWKTAICSRTRENKDGCPLCSGKVIVSRKNDLATKRPDLLKEWDYRENVDIDPTMVGIGSHRYAKWICNKCGYKWEVQIYNRTNGRGCPCCNNRVVVPGINDLTSTEPEIAKEWHPLKNGDLKPTEVTRGQAIKVWWLCSKCKNEWQDTINHRCSSKRGCSVCKREKRKRLK